MRIQKLKNDNSVGGCRNLFINAITWVLITVPLIHPLSSSASQSQPSNLDKACEFITNPLFQDNKINNDGPNMIVDSFGEKVAELNFKPSRINWKLAVLSLLEGKGSPAAQVRAVPPCRIISARQFGTTPDGDRIIISYGPDLKFLGIEAQNPPFVMSVQPVGLPHEPLLALVDTGVNYNLPMAQKNLAIDQDGQLIGYDFWDNDNRPFDKDPRRNAFFPVRCSASQRDTFGR